MSFLLMTFGIAVKSALYPFHTWLPDAYGNSTATSSALLSSLVSKLYIFLLIKIFIRAAGWEVFARRIQDVLLLYAATGAVMGSVHAIRQRHMTRMVAYSSVAQIGCIFLGIALGTEAGMAAAVYYLMAHSAAKSMLFLAASRLREVSDGEDSFKALRGSGLRAPLAGLAFTVGACSLVGIPLLGGFAGKVYLSSAGVMSGGWRMGAVLGALAASTLLNVAYMLRTLLTLYREKEAADRMTVYRDGFFTAAVTALIALNLLMGVLGGPILKLIEQGIRLFA
jgi:multicomponent Na+:H+ antiporter subunit D